MNLLVKTYLFPVLLFCLYFIAGCSSSGDSPAYNINPAITSPKVTYTNNANGATDIAVNTKSGAFFTSEMDPGTINSSTFILKQGSTPVSGKVTYNGLGAVFTPLQNLAPNTTYTATITNQARDLAGHSLESDYVWSWTTGARPPGIYRRKPCFNAARRPGSIRKSSRSGHAAL